MIFIDYYKGKKLTSAKSRFDITESTESYELFETMLLNKRAFNVGGLSFNYVPKPNSFKNNVDMAITKSNANITSIHKPDLTKKQFGYGDVNGTSDAMIFIFSDDENEIQILIARGYINDKFNLYESVCAGYLDEEISQLKKKAKPVLKEKLPIQ